jgi:hypothetical protein
MKEREVSNKTLSFLACSVEKMVARCTEKGALDH